MISEWAVYIRNSDGTSTKVDGVENVIYSDEYRNKLIRQHPDYERYISQLKLYLLDCVYNAGAVSLHES